MTDGFYPSLEDIEKRIDSLQEERSVLEWKVKELRDELRKINDELNLLYKLQEFLRSGYISGD